MKGSHMTTTCRRAHAFVALIIVTAVLLTGSSWPADYRAIAAAIHSPAIAPKPVFDDSTPTALAPITREEFAARRSKVYEGIGENIAVMCGQYVSPNEYRRPGQANNFYYLTGVDTPNSAVLLDGRTKQATLFVPGSDLAAAESISSRTGIEHIVAVAEFNNTVRSAAEGRSQVFMLAQPDEGYSQSRD